MSATVNSILARCIVDPAFLNRLATDPEMALREYSLNPALHADFVELDVTRLRHFAGVVTKVQNNGLWEHFPHTRALLNYYRLDLEVFTEYCEIHLQNRQAQLSRNKQIERFLSFLHEQLRLEDCGFPALREIVLHEQFTWELRVSFNSSSDRASNGADILRYDYASYLKLTPLKSDSLRIEKFVYNPLDVISALSQEVFNPAALKQELKWFCYWADGSTENLRILELDPDIAMLLMNIDGRRSIRSLLRIVSKHSPAGVRPSELRPFILQAFAEGLLVTADSKSSR